MPTLTINVSTDLFERINDWSIQSHLPAQQLAMDNSVKIVIERFVKKLPEYPNPRSIGKALKGQFTGLWRYSIDDYRLICSIRDDVLVVEVIKIGHRREIYKEK